MGKSIRSKVKRTWRSKKREDGVYAATEAARLERLNAKLVAKVAEPVVEPLDGDGDAMEDVDEAGESMPVDSSSAKAQASEPTKISTHGPRGSRREEWRKSKGLPPRPKSRGMNRQGTVAAGRKAGRSHRRR
ncbi:hypothetical protein PUNSTDRAFT_64970 [Punctularia strigosozonata HHB-11173 SS5]|uniref:uncharacterized protein n=1 Tax=Punctularia strigosozonata (strain HHB-11173) TaxID=741275 RepID=UPI0004417B86|nr:uncharacterized protein PUNSTDRAFT_64970 [Punctularia strigosozonata HHB-11173 SS5]EIN10677.1 hypothetical protein PUNSTDRAFT_64970 [Punctularia strigosozonata HHB-11173 SS5]